MDRHELNSMTAGACYPLAHALRKWWGRGEIHGLSDENGYLQHVFVLDGEVVLDGDGAQLLDGFVAKWQKILEDEQGVSLETTRPIWKFRDRIRHDIGGGRGGRRCRMEPVQDLLLMLRRRLPIS